MRLMTVVAPDAAQALARLRQRLGADAFVVATRELKGGGVQITGAVEDPDLDIAALLSPGEAAPCAGHIVAMADFHGLPDELRQRLLAAVPDLPEGDPIVPLGHALHVLFSFEALPMPAAAPLLLAGLPGAGKTASLAKLAARAVLNHHSVAVLTTDVGRAGGLEQLSALLAPLHIEARAAPNPGSLREALNDLTAEVVLIDSPGLNPFRSADLGALSALLEASGAEPVLVLPAGICAADSAEIAQTFAAIGCRRLLVTKLDAARRLGGVLAAAAAGLALCEAGIGPTIGRGLSPLTAAGLARLLLRLFEQAAGPAGLQAVPPRGT